MCGMGLTMAAGGTGEKGGGNIYWNKDRLMHQPDKHDRTGEVVFQGSVLQAPMVCYYWSEWVTYLNNRCLSCNCIISLIQQCDCGRPLP